MTQQLEIEDRDPLLAQILKGQMDAETELAVITGKLPTSYDGPSLEQQVAAARDEYLQQAEQRMAEELQAMAATNAAANAGMEMARTESLAIANAALAAQGRSARGW